jgi:hypothetical protein
MWRCCAYGEYIYIFRRRAPSVSWNDNYIYTLHLLSAGLFAQENEMGKLIGIRAAEN